MDEPLDGLDLDPKRLATETDGVELARSMK